MKKFAYKMIAVVLIIDIWLFWESKTLISTDYSFVTENISTTNALIYSVKEFEEEVESGNDRSTSVNTYTGYIYSYKFQSKGLPYSGKEVSFDYISTPNVEIEYLHKNPKENRIKEFAKVKTKFDFFKEYFMFKLIVLVIAILYSIFLVNEEKRKLLKK